MSITSFIQAMPKVELNLQFEGALNRDTIQLIAEQNDIPENFRHYRQWLAFLANPEYHRLDELVRTITQWIRLPEDLTRLIYDVGVALSKNNVRYAEVGICPSLYTEGGLTFEQFLNAINDGRNRVERAWGVQMSWILTVPRDQPRRADDAVRWATGTTARKGGVVGIGLSGMVSAQPISEFERAFKTAQKKGIPRQVEAGDLGGYDEIRQVMSDLEPDRIAGGWDLWGDPTLLAEMEKARVTIDLCLARAFCLGQLETGQNFPLRELYDQGLALTLNSGMPVLLKTSLNDEYRRAVEDCGLSARELSDIALQAVRASFLADEDRAVLLDEFTETYASLRVEHDVDE